ncbi:MAG TPA: hypothetical protein DCZ95_02705 [Verrucomicrobia bacterium]|nr:MAG: hypothetical protein A2X46_03655 [Lentisphaerae bacterium GWF2_57_35]HBA82982.1 hypothetical protein [Verrucomicrobiota bacterium]
MTGQALVRPLMMGNKTMKRFCAAVLFFLGTLASFGQIDVRCLLENEETLVYEPVRLTFQIINNTGADLVFQGTNANAVLDFEVVLSPGEQQVRRTRETLFPQGLTIPSRKTVVRMIDLLGSYDLRKEGPYRIKTRVTWNGTEYLSPKVLLDITPGSEIDRFAAGVPGGGGLRTCTLRIQRRERTEHLFLRIDDEEQGQCLGVYDLGQLVRLYKPRMQMDAEGNIHVLHQSGPWRYTHSVFGPNGVPVSHKFHTPDSNDVSFSETSDGTLEIKGVGTYDGGPDIPPSDRNPQNVPEDSTKPVDEPSDS